MDSPYRTQIGGDDGYYSVVTLRRKENSERTFSELVASQCEKIRDAVQHLIETYCQAFRVNFQLIPQPTVSSGNYYKIVKVIPSFLLRRKNYFVQ